MARSRAICRCLVSAGIMLCAVSASAWAGEFAVLPTVEDGALVPADTPERVAVVLQTLALLTILALAPSILIMTTCFTRIVVVFGFLRRALATQTLPPNQVVVGMSLFLTFFIMWPTWTDAWDNGLGPYLDGQQVNGAPMTQAEAFERTMAPVRDFMFRCLEDNNSRNELEIFMTLNNTPVPEDGTIIPSTVPTTVLMVSFMSSEMKRSFWMGFMLYLPFLIVDMVISSVLMAMGMMMLPPVMISLPFKIVLFVLADGWNLLVVGLVKSFPAITW